MKGKWPLLGFLCAIFVVYTVDRALLGLLASPIQREFGLNGVRYGVLNGGMFWTYAACVMFSGLAGDRFDRAKLIGFAVVAWSAMTVAAGFAGGFWTLFALASVAVVVPQTLYGPSSNALIAEYHRDTRTIALSLHQAAYYTGWFLSGMAVSAATGLFGGWRGAFIAFGVIGLALGLGFLAFARGFLRRPSRGADAARPAALPFSASVKAFFGCPTALLVSVPYVVETFIGCGYAAWGPKFVAKKLSLDTAAAGSQVMLWHYAPALAAILVAGFVTNALVKRLPRFRMALSSGALLVSAPALLVFAKATGATAVWSSAAVLGAMIGVIGANQFAVIFDVVPPRCRSGALGFLNVIAALAGSTAPIALGWLADHAADVGFCGLGGCALGFAAMAALQLAAFAALSAAIGFTFRRDFIREEG